MKGSMASAKRNNNPLSYNPQLNPTTIPTGYDMNNKNATTKITNLKEGQSSAYTACRECGKKFTQKNTDVRFRALAKHYYNSCQ